MVGRQATTTTALSRTKSCGWALLDYYSKQLHAAAITLKPTTSASLAAAFSI